MMCAAQKRYLLLGLLLASVYFVVFCFPNAAASADINMVRALTPDEGVPLPYVFDMIQPAGTVEQALINFAFYDYYFYGYPHFAVSALALLPLSLAGKLDETPLVMLCLRQVVSVLPMLLAVLGLVALQTGFHSYKSLVLLAFLLSVPALVQNNFWWHPDSLALLFMVTAIFFLNQDQLRFGRSFYLAAAMVGIAAQIKGIGFYFFLAVFVYLLIGLFGKKVPLPRLGLAVLGFLAVMAMAYFAANPILIYPGVRRRFFTVMGEQSRLLIQGYEIAYTRGPQAAWPLARRSFGRATFLMAALGAVLWGTLRGPRRLLHTIILAWALPLTGMVFFVIHFKPQYWLPVMLPLFSSLAVVLPERLQKPIDLKSAARTALAGLASLVLVCQFILFIRADVRDYNSQLHRAENDASIAFATDAATALASLDGRSIYIYRETNMYLPERPNWAAEGIFEMLNYDYITERNFDVVMVMQQRIADYLNPAAEAIDAAALAKSRAFYHDANQGALQGYTLIFRNGFGLIFVKDSLYQKYFTP